MHAPTRTPTKLDPARTAKAVERRGSSWELLPDQPIDTNRGGGSRRRLGRLAMLVVVCLGGAWAVWGEPSRWREWLPAGIVEQISAMTSRSPSAAAAPPTASGRQQSPGNRVNAEADGTAAQPSHELRANATLEPAEPAINGTAVVLNKPPASAASVGTAYAAPEAGADLLGKRAAAAGLHPDISRALLKRLSDADFQNAGVAVRKAVTETADDAVLTWPRQRKPELALFQVHFVPGAAPDCRRYVVTVTKDAWSTTALPMERCGIKPPRNTKSG